MAELSTDLLEIVLKDVAAAGVEPWYPAAYAQATGVARDRLDASLDRLRLAGLVRLTDWVQGRGQGYTLTPEGAHVLNNPRLLDRLREGRELPRHLEPKPAAPETLREPGTAWDRGEAVRQALLDRSRPAVTELLIWMNVAVFALGLWQAVQAGLFNEYFGTGVPAIAHELGGMKSADVTLQGQWWRLLSYCFVHHGFLHILMNMVFLYMVGSLVEKMWGQPRYLLLYLIAGVGGGCAQLLHYPHDRVAVLAGASGSLCGLLASMPVWVMMNRAYLPGRLVADWMRRILLNLVFIAAFSMLPRISWEGHLGGAVAGAVLAIPLNYSRFGRGPVRWAGWAGVAAVPAVAVALVYGSVNSARAANPEVRAELPADDPVVLRAREKYLPVYQKADSVIERIKGHLVAPFLNGARSPKVNPDAAREAAPVCSQAGKLLDKYATQLEGAEQFGNADITEQVGDARKYVRAWAKVFKDFAGSLQPAANWTERRRQALVAEYQRASDLSRPVRASTLFKPVLEDAP